MGNAIETESGKRLFKCAFYACILFSFVVLCLVLHYESADAQLINGWSLEYLLGVVLPFLSVSLINIALLANPHLMIRRLKSPVFFLFLAVGLVIFLLLVREINFPFHARIGFCTQVLLLILSAFALRHGDSNIFAIYCSVLGIALFLMLFEVPFLWESRAAVRFVSWADRHTFKYLFRTSEPLIGPGGRLRPNRRLRMTPFPPNWMGELFITNSAGFRNREEFTSAPQEDELRVLMLGDSFTAGCGVPQDEFLGPRLKRALQLQYPGRPISVMNAEVSDPANGALFLQRYGLGYQPDVVVYGLYPGNDFLQSFFTIGLPFSAMRFEEEKLVHSKQSDPERLREHGNKLYEEYLNPQETNPVTLVNLTAAPSIRQKMIMGFQQLRGLAAINLITGYISSSKQFPRAGEISPSWAFEIETRVKKKSLFEPGTALALFYRDDLPPMTQLYSKTFEMLFYMSDLCKKQDISFVLLYFPMRNQIQPQDWNRTAEVWNLKKTDFDQDKPNRTISAFAAKYDIAFLDPTETLREQAKVEPLYLTLDTHLNSAGYRLITELLFDEINRRVSSR